ncbi:hypothetical protein [Xenorhabdus beddingii]|nr:hypothetical protein [Xenorhabdus beddingii]
MSSPDAYARRVVSAFLSDAHQATLLRELEGELGDGYFCVIHNFM